MAQTILLDLNDGLGERDFTKFLDAASSYSHEQNKPSNVTLTFLPAVGAAGWALPQRGAKVRLNDQRWLSRIPGVRDGVLWTGYITEEPELILVGGAPGAPGGVYRYVCRCTSEDYLANIKELPNWTYVNQHRGAIIVDILHKLFADSAMPYDVSNVHTGGIERLFQIDTGKKFSEIIASFAQTDGFTYYVIDGCLVYQPEGEFMPYSNDPKVKLVVDQIDPRFSPDNLKIAPVSTNIINDVTVIGLQEPRNLNREHFISDGYQPFMQLAFLPFGSLSSNNSQGQTSGSVENSFIADDFTGDVIDTTKWFEWDATNASGLPNTPSTHLVPFQGSLNIVGGPGNHGVGNVYLRSNRGVELSGIIRTRDGEIQFPVGATAGQGIIGGLYKSANSSLLESDLVSAWRLYLDNATYGQPRIYAWGPAGQESAYFVPNLNHHYVLRRTFEVDRPFRSTTDYQSNADGYLQTFGADQDTTADAWITWQVDEINDDDVNNVFTITTTLLRQHYTSIAAFAVYAPVVTYDMHIVMNYVEVFQPLQVSVLVNGVPQTVGNALDGATCTITDDNQVPRLAWYATPQPLQAGRTGVVPPDAVTIPAQGSTVEIQYWASDVAISRITNAESIASERVRFRDNGVRQTIVHAGDIKPTPRTSEECQALALAYLADHSQPRYEGSFGFQTNANDVTELDYWIFPGDVIPVAIVLPDGTTTTQRLTVVNVDVSHQGNGCYFTSLKFGTIDRVREAIRQLVFKRNSTLDDPSLATVTPVNNQVAFNASAPADPTFTIGSVADATFAVTMGPSPDGVSLAAGVTGYEVRNDDTGWGKGNAVATFNTLAHTFVRNQRDISYFIRPFNASGVYSSRSAFVRIVHPLPFSLALTTVDGTISPEVIEVNITLPNNPDLAGVIVRDTNATGTVFYQGDGALTLQQATGVNAIGGTSRLTVRLPNPLNARSAVVWIAPYSLLKTVGTPAVFTINTPSPTIASITPTQDPNIFVWASGNVGPDTLADVTVFNPSGGVDNSFVLPAGQNHIDVGGNGIQKNITITLTDPWNPGGGSTAGYTRPGDTTVPSRPALQELDLPTVTSDGKTAIVLWVSFPVPANVFSADSINWQWSTDASFLSNVAETIDAWPAVSGSVPAATFSKTFTEPNANLYFRARGHNIFGWGDWSLPFSASTGSALDPLALGGGWNFLNPAIRGLVRLGGTAAFTIDNANDGTGRTLTGLTSSGFVGLNLLNSTKQFDPFGSGQTLVNRSNGVSVLADGTVVLTGAGRALSAIDASLTYTSTIAFGARYLDNVGNPRQAFLISSDTVDSVGDGFVYQRTTFTQVTGAGLAFAGLDGSAYLKSGINAPGTGNIPTSDIGDGWFRSIVAISGGGGRITNDRVDSFSIQIGAVHGANISPDYRSTAGDPGSGSGFDRQI